MLLPGARRAQVEAPSDGRVLDQAARAVGVEIGQRVLVPAAELGGSSDVALEIGFVGVARPAGGRRRSLLDMRAVQDEFTGEHVLALGRPVGTAAIGARFVLVFLAGHPGPFSARNRSDTVQLNCETR